LHLESLFATNDVSNIPLQFKQYDVALSINSHQIGAPPLLIPQLLTNDKQSFIVRKQQTDIFPNELFKVSRRRLRCP